MPVAPQSTPARTRRSVAVLAAAAVVLSNVSCRPFNNRTTLLSIRPFPVTNQPVGGSGSRALIAPSMVPAEIARFDAPVMVAVSLLLVIFAATGLRVGRREGAVLLAGYAVYLWVLWP